MRAPDMDMSDESVPKDEERSSVLYPRRANNSYESQGFVSPWSKRFPPMLWVRISRDLTMDSYFI